MISSNEDLIQICNVVDGELVFTKEYLNEMRIVSGSARKFASHLAGGWDKDSGKLLDYFGPDELDEDIYSGVDGEPMDICEILPFRLAMNDTFMPGLTADWYRDVIRFRLVNLKIPKRIIKEYLDKLKNNF